MRTGLTNAATNLKGTYRLLPTKNLTRRLKVFSSSIRVVLKQGATLEFTIFSRADLEKNIRTTIDRYNTYSLTEIDTTKILGYLTAFKIKIAGLKLNLTPRSFAYVVNGRSPLKRIIERCQVKVDSASGIENNPNDWATEHGNPRYVKF